LLLQAEKSNLVHQKTKRDKNEVSSKLICFGLELVVEFFKGSSDLRIKIFVRKMKTRLKKENSKIIALETSPCRNKELL